MHIKHVLPLVVLVFGCSSSTEDPLAEKCEQTCKIEETHPCYDGGKGIEDCVKKCRAAAGSVERNPAYLKTCAECVAGQFTYAVKPPPCTATSADRNCCYDGYVIQPKKPEEVPACLALCIEPDGGAGY